MSNPVAVLYGKVQQAEQKYLAELDALTDQYRSSLRQLISDAAAALPSLSVKDTAQVSAQRLASVEDNESVAPRATPAEGSSTAAGADVTLAAVDAAQASEREQPVQTAAGSKRRQSKAGPLPATKRTRASKTSNHAGSIAAHTLTPGQSQQATVDQVTPSLGQPCTSKQQPTAEPMARGGRRADKVPNGTLAADNMPAGVDSKLPPRVPAARTTRSRKATAQQQKVEQEQPKGACDLDAVPESVQQPKKHAPAPSVHGEDQQPGAEQLNVTELPMQEHQDAQQQTKHTENVTADVGVRPAVPGSHAAQEVASTAIMQQAEDQPSKPEQKRQRKPRPAAAPSRGKATNRKGPADETTKQMASESAPEAGTAVTTEAATVADFAAPNELPGIMATCEHDAATVSDALGAAYEAAQPQRPADEVNAPQQQAAQPLSEDHLVLDGPRHPPAAAPGFAVDTVTAITATAPVVASTKQKKLTAAALKAAASAEPCAAAAAGVGNMTAGSLGAQRRAAAPKKKAVDVCASLPQEIPEQQQQEQPAQGGSELAEPRNPSCYEPRKLADISPEPDMDNAASGVSGAEAVQQQLVSADSRSTMDQPLPLQLTLGPAVAEMHVATPIAIDSSNSAGNTAVQEGLFVDTAVKNVPAPVTISPITAAFSCSPLPATPGADEEVEAGVNKPVNATGTAAGFGAVVCSSDASPSEDTACMSLDDEALRPTQSPTRLLAAAECAAAGCSAHDPASTAVQLDSNDQAASEVFPCSGLMAQEPAAADGEPGAVAAPTQQLLQSSRMSLSTHTSRDCPVASPRRSPHKASLHAGPQFDAGYPSRSAGTPALPSSPDQSPSKLPMASSPMAVSPVRIVAAADEQQCSTPALTGIKSAGAASMAPLAVDGDFGVFAGPAPAAADPGEFAFACITSLHRDDAQDADTPDMPAAPRSCLASERQNTGQEVRPLWPAFGSSEHPDLQVKPDPVVDPFLCKEDAVIGAVGFSAAVAPAVNSGAMEIAAEEGKEEVHAPAVPGTASAADPKPATAAGGNLVAAVRSFLPVKRPLSPQIAAGKKQVKVRALEAAHAAKRAEEAKAADKTRAREQQQTVRQPTEPPCQGLLSPGGAPPAGPGLVKLKAAAFQQRIHQDEEARKAEEMRRGHDREKEEVARHANDQGSKPSASASQHDKQKQPVNIRQQPFSTQTSEKGKRADQGQAAPAAPQQQRLDANDKHKRAEQRRKEEEERRKGDLEAKQKLKDQRAKAAKQQQQQPQAIKLESGKHTAAALVGTSSMLHTGASAAAASAAGTAGIAAGAAGRAPAPCFAASNRGTPLQLRSTNLLHAAAAATPSLKKAPMAPVAALQHEVINAPAAATVATTSQNVSSTSAAACTSSYAREGTAQRGTLEVPSLVHLRTPQAGLIPGLASVGPKQNRPAPAAYAAQQPPMTPAELAQEERNIQMLVSSPYVNPGIHRTPGLRAGATNQVLSYEISPYKSDSEEEDWEPNPNRKPVPEWTQAANLKVALQKQQKFDPDKLFDTKMKTCPLDEIFEGMPPLPPPADPAKARKRRDWRKRGSSGNWIKDRLTWQEEISYKKAMGFC